MIAQIHMMNLHKINQKQIGRIHAIICTCICPLITDTHTNKLRLVMTLIALCCTWQIRAPNFDRWNLTLTSDLSPWHWPRPLTLTLKQGISDVKKQILAFDLDLWPTTLTYNPSQAQGSRLIPMIKIKVVGQTVHLWEHWQTDGRTGRRYQVHDLPRFASWWSRECTCVVFCFVFYMVTHT